MKAIILTVAFVLIAGLAIAEPPDREAWRKMSADERNTIVFLMGHSPTDWGFLKSARLPIYKMVGLVDHYFSDPKTEGLTVADIYHVARVRFFLGDVSAEMMLKKLYRDN